MLVLAIPCWIAVLIFFPALTLVPDVGQQWIHGLYEKKNARANGLTGKRLFVVGGSNVLFGVNSKELERISGLSVVNMGTYGGLHLSYHMYNLEHQMRHGDTILLMLEYNYLDPAFDYTSMGIDYAMLYDLRYVLSRDPLTMMRHVLGFRLFPNIVETLRNVSGVVPDVGYSLATVNGYGDETRNTLANRTPADLARIQASEAIVPFDPVNAPAKPLLESFTKLAEQRGVRVIAAWPVTIRQPAYSTPQYDAFFNGLREFYERLGIATLGDPVDEMAPSEDMFDTSYHPLDTVNERRSRKLAVNLCQIVACVPRSVGITE